MKDSLYVCVMFPYPSGSGLHIGHYYNYAVIDSYCRYWRSKGAELFKRYSNEWKEETAGLSTIRHIVSDPNYRAIISLGQEVVPYILMDLEKESNYWYEALEEITNENPVPDEHVGTFSKMREDWLAWGKRKNLI